VILFKTPRQQTEWESSELSPMVRLIVLDAASFVFDRYSEDVTITDVWRTDEEEAALHGHYVHNAWRAVDLRRLSSHDRSQELEDYLNGRYVYDPTRPAMKVAFGESAGELHGTAEHLHVQVHALTAFVAT
jgi:hypothetical protein